MIRNKKWILFLIITTITIYGFASFNRVALSEGVTLFYEDFDSLEKWEHFVLFQETKPTSYTLVKEAGQTCLKAESNSSSSAKIHVKEFNVYQYPRLRWRWRVDNIYRREDLTKKEGNDAPARVYVLFKYNPKKADFFQRIRYSIAKRRYGQYPPDSGLCYVWASRTYKETIFKDPKWKIVKTIVLENAKNLKTWREERVNIVDDYKKAFGKNPPFMARIAIMNDSNNTKEQAVSYFDYIEVFR